MLDAFARAVTRRAIIKYARTVYRRLESTSRDLVPSVSQPLENIQHTSEFNQVLVKRCLVRGTSPRGSRCPGGCCEARRDESIGGGPEEDRRGGDGARGERRADCGGGKVCRGGGGEAALTGLLYRWDDTAGRCFRDDLGPMPFGTGGQVPPMGWVPTNLPGTLPPMPPPPAGWGPPSGGARRGGALLPMQPTGSPCRRVPGPPRAYDNCGSFTAGQRSRLNGTGLYWLWCDLVPRFDVARWQLAAGDTLRQWWVYPCRSFPASALLELP